MAVTGAVVNSQPMNNNYRDNPDGSRTYLTGQSAPISQTPTYSPLVGQSGPTLSQGYSISPQQAADNDRARQTAAAAPAPSASMSGLQSAAGATVPTMGPSATPLPPVTSGGGDGGNGMDSGIDRILAQQGGGGAAMAGLRYGLGQRSYPSSQQVVGRKAY